MHKLRNKKRKMQTTTNRRIPLKFEMNAKKNNTAPNVIYLSFFLLPIIMETPIPNLEKGLLKNTPPNINCDL